MRVFFCIKMLVHVLQDILYADLLAIAYRPYRMERQALDDCRFEDEDRRSTRPGYEIHTLGMQLGDGLRKDTVMPGVQ